MAQKQPTELKILEAKFNALCRYLKVKVQAEVSEEHGFPEPYIDVIVVKEKHVKY